MTNQELDKAAAIEVMGCEAYGGNIWCYPGNALRSNSHWTPSSDPEQALQCIEHVTDAPKGITWRCVQAPADGKYVVWISGKHRQRGLVPESTSHSWPEAVTLAALGYVRERAGAKSIRPCWLICPGETTAHLFRSDGISVCRHRWHLPADSDAFRPAVDDDHHCGPCLEWDSNE